MYTETLTQRLALGNGVKPQTLNNSNTNSDGVDLAKSHRAFFVITVGANAGTLGFYLQESADNATWPASGTASPFSNSGGANVSQTGITANTTEYSFEVRTDQLTTGKRYVRLNVVESAGANATVAVVGFGDEANHKPNSANNGANVVTQNVVS